MKFLSAMTVIAWVTSPLTYLGALMGFLQALLS